MAAHPKTALPGTRYAAALAAFRRRIGQRLVIAREHAGFTHRSLANHLGLAAWSHIASVEAGRMAASPKLAKKLARALKAPDLEEALLQAREPISSDVLAFLIENPKELAKIEKKITSLDDGLKRGRRAQGPGQG